jgi:hypothetical protein
MKPYLYNLILTVLAGVALIVPFTGKVHDGRFKWFKRLTARGWILLVAVLGSVIITFLKDIQSDKDDANKVAVTKNEKRRDDSISRKRNDESNASIVNSFTNALAKNGLKFDSAENVIKKIVKDSTKKVIHNLYGNHPELSVKNIEIKTHKNDSLVFTISIYTKQAATYHTMLNIYTVLELEDKSYYLIPDNRVLTISDLMIPLDATFGIPKGFRGEGARLKKGTFFFIFSGSYFDADSKKFPFKTICSYTLESNQFGSIMEPENTQLKNFLDEKGIKY